MTLKKKILTILLTAVVINSAFTAAVYAKTETDEQTNSVFAENDQTEYASYQDVKELDNFLTEERENALKECEIYFYKPFLCDEDSNLSFEKIVVENEQSALDVNSILSENEFSESMYEIITDPDAKNYKDVYEYFSKDQEFGIYGDLNNDLITDLTDLTKLSLYLMQQIEFDDKLVEAADIDANGIVDIVDLAYYKQYVCKDQAIMSKLRINEKLKGNFDDSSAIKAEQTIEDGVYFIKNKNSERYLDVYNGDKTNNTRVIQYSYNGAMNQRFRISYHTNSIGEGYYTIEPLHITGQKKAFDLSGKADSCLEGTNLKIYSSNSTNYEEQRFIISAADENGYQISSWASEGDMVLRPADSSKDSGVGIETCKKSSAGDDSIWYFDLVDNGMAYHTVTTRISDSDISQGKDIAASFKKLGYASVYRYNADKETIIADAENSIALVFHGHANSYGIKTDEDDGWILPCEDPDAGSNCVTISDIIKPEFADKVQFVYYCTCDGAAADPKFGISMVDATYELGVKCVIGFKNGVAGGEDYLQYMMNYLKENKGATIQNALDYADSLYTDTQKKNDGCPANKDNRVVKGDPDIVLDLRLS